jgi:hypothetical protein
LLVIDLSTIFLVAQALLNVGVQYFLQRLEAGPRHMYIARFADTHRIDKRVHRRRGEAEGAGGEIFQHGRLQPLSPASFTDCVLHDARSGLRATVASREAEYAVARELVEQRYTARGYRSMSDVGRPAVESHALTILAMHGDTTVGTMTLRFDSVHGLNVDEAYGREVDALRAEGGVACELTCLAVAEHADSQATLAVLFRMAYYAADQLGVTDVFIEVNPRHERFYRRVLGFTVAAEVRNCPRVQAPAVLLHQDMICLGARLGGFPPPTRSAAALAAA